MSNKKRLVLVDVSHIAFNFFAVRQNMSYVVDGKRIDTRIPTGIVKNVWKWSNFGEYDIIVCFDRSCHPRKEYFEQGAPILITGESENSNIIPPEEVEYKGGRSHVQGIREGLFHAEQVLRKGGTPVLAQEGYEADDLIGACITSFYNQYDNIDVITGDFDLLPLVDDKVSVFMRCRKTTFAEDPALRKNNYVQITPNSFDQLGFFWSKLSKIDMPYNAVLLQKMLQGDSSDNIPGVMTTTKTGTLRRKYPDGKFNKLINDMTDDGVDFSSIFRYSLLNNNQPQLVEDTLSNYMDDNDIITAMYNYHGMDLNGSLPQFAHTVDDVEEVADPRKAKGIRRGRFEVGGSPLSIGVPLVRAALGYGIHLS